ncbi:MAG: DUF3880 domain-containing protein [Lachnospiraceae bacterium]|nr:DUF3880 domain-containing protein [Lachnospiraceae bacterium]
MRLLLYRWGANNEQILRDNLISSGHDVIECSKKCRNYTADVELAAEIIGLIHSSHIDAIISFNYFPIITMAADAAGIKYYSWVYDCPHFTLFAKTVGMQCNRIGIFDSDMVEDLRSRGINTVFHLPLAVDTERWSELIGSSSEKENAKYFSDVSFVGSLYTDEHNYFDRIFEGGNDRDIKDVCEISKEDMEQAISKMADMGLMLGPDYSYKPEDIVIPSVFEKEQTILERSRLLWKVSAMEGIEFKLYTNSKTDMKNQGTVDYETKMPLVFAKSRINLNISLKSIHTGIPLRVLDILSCGGFVLSNYQKEIAEFFEEDKEIVLFRSADEAMEKIRYYVNHEGERAQIAKAGFKAVKERFGYKERIGELLSPVWDKD